MMKNPMLFSKSVIFSLTIQMMFLVKSVCVFTGETVSSVTITYGAMDFTVQLTPLWDHSP